MKLEFASFIPAERKAGQVIPLNPKVGAKLAGQAIKSMKRRWPHDQRNAFGYHGLGTRLRICGSFIMPKNAR